VSGNNLVWRKVTFPALATSSIRVLITSALNIWSRVAEVEAYQSARRDVALAANGGTASASSTHSSGYAPSGAINGDRMGLSWGSGGGWNDATWATSPDWLQVDFNGSKTIDEIDVFSVQDNYLAPVDPTSTLTFSLYGLIDFQVQYWTGSQWLTVPNGTVSGNNLVWRKVIFGALTTSSIRLVVTHAVDGWSRVAEIEAWGTSP
jgi:peptidyl-Asp metalloendopeptidase